MERRKSRRISYRLEAKITSGGRTYSGTIENISEAGVEYLLTALDKTSEDFAPDKVIKLDFIAPSGSKINLDCEVKWFLKAMSDGGKLTMGMKIINPPPQYKELITSLIDKNDK